MPEERLYVLLATSTDARGFGADWCRTESPDVATAINDEDIADKL